MIVLRFGRSGRLARICETALQLARPTATVYTANRERSFVSKDTCHATLDALLKAHPGEKILWLDASIDHSSTENLIAHEAFKRQILSTLDQRGLLERAVGVSSGITLVDRQCIQTSAIHMLEYRHQKQAQEQQYANLRCPYLLPNLFTLVGPITYAGQSAAWAQVLKARVARTESIVLNEPHVRKAWVSEFQVLQAVLGFLATSAPVSQTGALVSGDFSLAEIAGGNALPLMPLAYTQGTGIGWLAGDYVPSNMQAHDTELLSDAMLRSICP